MKDQIIAKVRVSKTGQKTVTIPRSHLIKADDYVVVSKAIVKE